MCSFNPWPNPGGRLLRHYLSRLGQTLDNLTGRLREAVSVAVGETVAAIVREAVHALLEESPPDPAAPGPVQMPNGVAHRLWAGSEDRDGTPWLDDAEGWPAHAAAVDKSFDQRGGVADALQRPAWRAALALGVRAGLWWLRRGVGRFPVLTALGAGLLTTLAAYAGGPLAAAGVGLTGSALGLLSVADAIRTGADALTVCGTS